MQKTFIFLLLLVTSAIANAVPITFIHSGNGSGTIDGVAFTDSDVVFTATGNTDDRISSGGTFIIDHLTASVEISGVGVFDFVTGTNTYVNNTVESVGFSRAPGPDLFNGPFTTSEFGVWDMLSSIGPISGVGNFLQWDLTPVITSGGELFFESEVGGVTFEAIVSEVSAPSTMLLLLTSIGYVFFRRK